MRKIATLSSDLFQKNLLLASQARKIYKKDKFLKDILYAELLTLSYMHDYSNLKIKSEKFMVTYPDYRMMWAVENFYEKLLEKLGKK